MKRTIVAIALTSILALPAAWAADDDESLSGSSAAGKSGASSGIMLSKLTDAKVMSKADEDLGEIEDLLVNPQTGQVTYAILGRGGFLGIGEKMVPVPWKALNVDTTGEKLTVNVDKEKLQSAPTTDKSYTNLQDPGYTVTIYRFYAVPVEVGGAETPGGLEQGQDLSGDTEATTEDEDIETDESSTQPSPGSGSSLR